MKGGLIDARGHAVTARGCGCATAFGRASTSDSGEGPIEQQPCQFREPRFQSIMDSSSVRTKGRCAGDSRFPNIRKRTSATSRDLCPLAYPNRNSGSGRQGFRLAATQQAAEDGLEAPPFGTSKARFPCFSGPFIGAGEQQNCGYYTCTQGRKSISSQNQRSILQILDLYQLPSKYVL
jgi:hypothetical protein